MSVNAASIQPVDLLSKSPPESVYPSKKTKKEIITGLFKSCVVEIACSFALTGVSYIFISEEGRFSLLVLSGAVVAVSVLFKSIAAYLKYRNQQISDEIPSNIEKKKALNSVGETLGWLVPFNFALLYNATAGVLIHEGGHALAASLLYKNAQARVVINFLFEGSTTFINRGLSVIGSSLGISGAKILVAAAGPLAVIATVSAVILVAMAIQKSHPKLSKYLYFSSLFSLVYNVRYALSALTASVTALDHDFVQLSNHGIHPLVAAGVMVAIPAIVAIVYCRVKKSFDASSKV